MSNSEKMFHIAFWISDNSANKMLGGVNYQATDVGQAIEMYANDDWTPSLSDIKYIIEIGKNPMTFGLTEC